MSNYDVFISYSRKDDADHFVTRMKAALEAAGLRVWMDDKIVSSAEWWAQIETHIERSHNFLLFISEHSLASEWCQREIAHAFDNGKRLIAFQLSAIDEKRVKGSWMDTGWEQIARANWEPLRKVQWIADHLGVPDFAAAVERIRADAQTDPAYVEAHTDLLLQANKWEESGKSPGFHLSGEPLAEAEAWLAAWDGKTLPAPTDLQRAFVSACRAAQDEKEARELLYDQVQQQKALLETTYNTSPTGLIALDSELRVVQGNLALDRALMAQSNDFVGLPVDNLLSVAGVEEGARLKLREALKGGTEFHQDMRHQDHSYEVSGAPLPLNAGWVLVFNDVTNLKQLIEARKRVLQVVSHELRNQVGLILLSSDKLNLGFGGSNFTSEDKNIIQIIRNSSVTLARIIDGILNTERNQLGKIEFQSVNLLVLVSEAIERNESELTEKALTFKADLPRYLPVVRGNAPQLIQVMSNLLGNAIKYSRYGDRVTVRLMSLVDHIRYEVEDTGYGIATRDKPRIFQEFAKVRTKETLHIPGTGMGLSMAKAIVESHGGKIGFVSEEGKGSTFFFELPFAPQEQA